MEYQEPNEALMKMMERQFAHAQLPKMTAEELARQDFVQSYKLHLATKVVPQIKKIFEEDGKPAFRRQNGHAPANRHEVESVVKDHPYYRMWGSLARTGQELCWNSVTEPVLRQIGELAQQAMNTPSRGGTLTLQPEVAMPNYLTAVDIHCMPGSYGMERFEGDVGQGAIYDRGGYIYGMGGAGPKSDAAGRMTSNYLLTRFPDRKFARILDLGCGVGHALLPYAVAFPDAELHGIDVSAPMLRYAHSRAEALGTVVHFKQMNAEAMDYPDGYFDLVVSHIVLHETSTTAVGKILRECHRVAAPDGVVAHLDMCFFEELDPFDAFMLGWDTANNNEPFWSTFRNMDAKTLLTNAGFEAEKLFGTKISRSFGNQAVFSEHVNDAGRGTWNLIGAIR